MWILRFLESVCVYTVNRNNNDTNSWMPAESRHENRVRVGVMQPDYENSLGGRVGVCAKWIISVCLVITVRTYIYVLLRVTRLPTLRVGVCNQTTDTSTVLFIYDITPLYMLATYLQCMYEAVITCN